MKSKFPSFKAWKKELSSAPGTPGIETFNNLMKGYQELLGESEGEEIIRYFYELQKIGFDDGRQSVWKELYEKDICPHCLEFITIKTGGPCEHVYYPEGCKTCQKIMRELKLRK